MPADHDLADFKIAIYRRLVAERRWEQAVPIRDDLIREARAAGLKREDAQRRAYESLNEMFPPLGAATTSSELDAAWDASNDGPDGAPGALDALGGVVDTLTTAGQGGRPRTRTQGDESPVVGLGEIPAGWPPLPPNAPLGTEIQWVQANRLRCIRDEGDRTVVDLSKAMAAAPSYAALGWLETSIRVFSKFVDVAAKVTASMEDEQEHARRERVAIEDVRRLLGEMLAE